jgi:hypothetical protein
MPAITIKITNLAAVVRKRADFSQDRTKGGLGFCILARSMLVGAWLCEFFLQNEPTRQSTKSADLGSLLGRSGLKTLFKLPQKVVKGAYLSFESPCEPAARVPDRALGSVTPSG